MVQLPLKQDPLEALEAIERMERELAALKAHYAMPTATVQKPETITLTEAVELFGADLDEDAKGRLLYRIRKWVTREALPIAGRDFGPGPGGVIRVRIADVERLMQNPPKRGPRTQDN